MDNVESSAANGNGGALDSRRIQVALDRSAVGTACEAAATALDILSKLLIGDTLSDDPSIAHANARLSMMLAGVGEESCESLADARAKLGMLRRLRGLLPIDDSQMQIFTHDVVRDIADFLDGWDLH
ncbi:MAG: hypothetical protein ABI369_08335 [Acetobacteraceae bacterium]